MQLHHPWLQVAEVRAQMALVEKQDGEIIRREVGRRREAEDRLREARQLIDSLLDQLEGAGGPGNHEGSIMFFGMSFSTLISVPTGMLHINENGVRENDNATDPHRQPRAPPALDHRLRDPVHGPAHAELRWRPAPTR
jgi:hypothetical protein